MSFVQKGGYVQNFSSDPELPKNLIPSEYKVLKCLSKNKNIVIQKADKGNIVVILDKCSYIRVLEETLKTTPSFLNLTFVLVRRLIT